MNNQRAEMISSARELHRQEMLKSARNIAEWTEEQRAEYLAYWREKPLAMIWDELQQLRRIGQTVADIAERCDRRLENDQRCIARFTTHPVYTFEQVKDIRDQTAQELAHYVEREGKILECYRALYKIYRNACSLADVEPNAAEYLKRRTTAAEWRTQEKARQVEEMERRGL